MDCITVKNLFSFTVGVQGLLNGPGSSRVLDALSCYLSLILTICILTIAGRSDGVLDDLLHEVSRAKFVEIHTKLCGYKAFYTPGRSIFLDALYGI